MVLKLATMRVRDEAGNAAAPSIFFSFVFFVMLAPLLRRATKKIGNARSNIATDFRGRLGFGSRVAGVRHALFISGFRAK